MASDVRGDAVGLARGTVRVVAPRGAWAARYAELAAALVAAVGTDCVAIEHIGSTAVPDLPAKPVIDIALQLRAGCDVPAPIAPLERLGYEYRGDAGSEGGHVFVLVNRANERVANLHVLGHGDPQWDAYLRFRDQLRSDSSARATYAHLKHELARRFPNDRAAYMAGKSPLIREVLEARSP